MHLNFNLNLNLNLNFNLNLNLIQGSGCLAFPYSCIMVDGFFVQHIFKDAHSTYDKCLPFMYFWYVHFENAYKRMIRDFSTFNQ